MDLRARHQAQQRVDRIRAFQEELSELEREQTLVLTPEQRVTLEARHQELLSQLTAQFDLDVTEAVAWERAVAEILEADGRIDVLVNNAGVCLPGACAEVSAEDDRLTVEVNLFGVMNGVRTFLPRFLGRDRGHFINVASMAAFAPVPDLAAYCATKHAVRAYTHSCALDHRHAPIHWTLACPSAVETPMLQSMRKKQAGVVVFNETPMPPERMAQAILDTIREPKREVLVPRTKGNLLRLLGLFPGLLSRGMDEAERRGRDSLGD